MTKIFNFFNLKRKKYRSFPKLKFWKLKKNNKLCAKLISFSFMPLPDIFWICSTGDVAVDC